MTSVQKGNNKREKNNNLSLQLSSVNKGGNKETHTWDVSLQRDRLWTASYGVQNWAARCVPRHLAVKIITRCSQKQILASQILSELWKSWNIEHFMFAVALTPPNLPHRFIWFMYSFKSAAVDAILRCFLTPRVSQRTAFSAYPFPHG